MTSDSDILLEWIDEGEHEQQDFKFAVNEARKIALSLCAFANTNGGRLLIGVKDNGVISGVRSDEEIHMIDTAADLYTSPPVEYTTHLWEIDGKVVVEVRIPRSSNDYHLARMKDGSSQALVRFHDQNRKATPVHLDIWKNRNNPQPKGAVSYSDRERKVLQLIGDTPGITLNQIQKLSAFPRKNLIHFLARMIQWRVLRFTVNNDRFGFALIP